MSDPTSTAVCASERLPTLHGLVLTPEQQAAFMQCLNPCLKGTDEPAAWAILKWRWESQAIHLIEDADLKAWLTTHLPANRHIAVWHGQQALYGPALQRLLGRGWRSQRPGRLDWTRTDTPWNTLLERLNRPDESVVRQLLATHGQHTPHWPDLPEPINAAGAVAHRHWYNTHLADLQEEWAAWLDQAQQEPNNSVPQPAPPPLPNSAPQWHGTWRRMAAEAANDPQHTVKLQAGSDGKTSTTQWQAVLQPTQDTAQWLSDPLTPKRAPDKAPKAPPTTPTVTLSYDVQTHNCHVTVSLAGGDNRMGEWLLWLYPSQGWPVALRFSITTEQQTIACPSWPTSDRPSIERINQGSLTLEKLPNNTPPMAT